jgi:ribonuclease III
LGDSVLGFIVSGYLFGSFPSAAEGKLTEMRVALVRTNTLARAGERISLGTYLQIGKGEEANGGRRRASILEGAFEALVGAVYLDRGIRVARSFVMRQLASDLESLRCGPTAQDPKSALQEYTQRCMQQTPSYHTVSSTGPDHAKVFLVEARLGDMILAAGEGSSKQAAERAAAHLALLSLIAEAGE